MALLPPANDPIWKLAGGSNSRLPDPSADVFFASPCAALSLLARGASRDYCDWGIDIVEESQGCSRSYQWKMRYAFSLLVLRARWHATKGDAAASVDDLLTALRVIRLIPGRHGLMSDVGWTLELEETTITSIGRTALLLDAVQRQRLLSGLSALPAPIKLVDALHREQVIARRLLVRLLSEPEETRKRILGVFFSAPEKFSPWDPFSDTNLRSWFAIYERQVAQLEERLGRPLIEQLDEMVLPDCRPLPNPFSYLFIPGWQRTVRRQASMLVVREQLAAALAYIDGGEPAFILYRNELSGQPFALEKTAGGFRLRAEVPGKREEFVWVKTADGLHRRPGRPGRNWSFADLVVGEPSPENDAVKDAPAVHSPPSDF